MSRTRARSSLATACVVASLLAALGACKSGGGTRSSPSAPNAPDAPDLEAAIIDAHRAATLATRRTMEQIAQEVASLPETAEGTSLPALPQRLTFWPPGREPTANTALLDASDLHSLERADAQAPCRFRYDTPLNEPFEWVARGYRLSVRSASQRVHLESGFAALEALRYVSVCRTFELQLPRLVDGEVVQGIHRGDVLLYELSSGRRVGQFAFTTHTALTPEELGRASHWFQGDRIALANAVSRRIEETFAAASP